MDRNRLQKVTRVCAQASTVASWPRQPRFDSCVDIFARARHCSGNPAYCRASAHARNTSAKLRLRTQRTRPAPSQALLNHSRPECSALTATSGANNHYTSATAPARTGTTEDTRLALRNRARSRTHWSETICAKMTAAQPGAVCHAPTVWGSNPRPPGGARRAPRAHACPGSATKIKRAPGAQPRRATWRSLQPELCTA